MPISTQNAPALNASSTDVAFFFLLTVSDGVNPDIRLVNNNEDVVSRGQTFMAYPFSLVLPDDDTTRAPTCKITVDNVDLRLIEMIRALPDAPTVKVELVTSAYPDLVEREIDYLKVRSVDYDALAIQFTLEIQNILARKFPEGSYDPIQVGDLFYG